MARARRSRGRSLALVGLLAGGCGDGCGQERTAAAVVVEAGEGGAAPREDVVAAGDPLLSRAREGIREGVLPEPLRAEVVGSRAPEHARARRVLLAMDQALAGPDAVAPAKAEASADERPRPPPILPPGDASAVPEAVEPARPSHGEGGKPTSAASGERPVRGRAEVGGLSFRSSTRGATLTIAAPSSLVVGVANQPSSGIVRLIIESAQAGSAVLDARPRVEGAAVTGVRQGQGTVQITVRLDPGWTLDKVQPFAGGAKVHLVAPP